MLVVGRWSSVIGCSRQNVDSGSWCRALIVDDGPHQTDDQRPTTDDRRPSHATEHVDAGEPARRHGVADADDLIGLTLAAPGGAEHLQRIAIADRREAAP